MTEQRRNFHGGEQHPEEWRQDLNPDAHQGLNYGGLGSEPGSEARTAYDHKAVHDLLANDFQDQELKDVLVLPAGTRLQQGGVYVDLRDPERRRFKATGDMEAHAGSLYVAKDQTPYPLWKRLIGVQNSKRLDQADVT